MKLRYAIALAAVAALGLGNLVMAASNGPSIAINFGSSEPNGGNLAAVEGAAGVFQTQNWANTDGANDIDGPLVDLIIDDQGVTSPSSAFVEWTSNNLWASDGRGEDINDAPDGPDRALMVGYLDTNAADPAVISVNDVDSVFTSGGYDVYLYALGGVLGRGGDYGIGAKGITQTSEADQVRYHEDTVVWDGLHTEYMGTADSTEQAGSYVVFRDLDLPSFTILAQPIKTRAPTNGIEIVQAGAIPSFVPSVAGAGNIGVQGVSGSQDNLVFGDPTTGPGLAQEWYATANPGSKDAADAVFAGQQPVTGAFRSATGSFWTGNGDLPGIHKYPPEVQPPLEDNYTTRLTGEILIEGDGPFTFTDGIDDFTWLAIDTDRSGTAGDSAEEVLINDNSWTTVLRDGNNGGEGYAEINITGVPAGGEWLAFELNTGEGGGGDSGTVYWDYDPSAPAGQEHGGILLPFVDGAFLSAEEAAAAVIPESHLRGTTAPLLSGDFLGSIPGSEAGWQFEINAGDGSADVFSLDNPNPDVFSTTLDVDGALFHLDVTGDPADGQTFQIVSADTVTGTPNISNEGWSWDGSTGSVIFGSGGPMIPGDADGDGDVDTNDRNIQVTNWTGALQGGPDANKTKEQGDADGDGDVDTADANIAVVNWTGAQQGPAGNLEDGDDADLVYDPASGNVTLDASDTASGVFISFVMATGQNNMVPDNLTKSADGSAGPFFDVGTNTDATTFQIGQTDPLNQGAGPEIDLGDIFPAGMDLDGLSEYLTLADYASALGEGGTLDLIVVPEPSSIALLLLGAMGLVARRRRK